MIIVVKFWKEDFKYIKIIEAYYGYDHVFSVHGESVNYLRSKYDLKYPNVKVHLFIDDDTLTVVSRTDNLLFMDNVVIDKEDTKELMFILQEIMDKGLM